MVPHLWRDPHPAKLGDDSCSLCGQVRAERPAPVEEYRTWASPAGLAMDHHRARVFGAHGRDGIKYMFWSPAGSDSNLILASSSGVTSALPVSLKRESNADS